MSSGLSLWTLAAIAQVSPTAGTEIRNKAYGSFQAEDNLGAAPTVVESNEVIVTISEVAGITVTASGSNDDGEVNPDDVISFDFTITNVGNDPSQFFIPGVPSSITNGSFNNSTNPIQIIAYDPDGSETEASSQTVSITVPSAGISTGDVSALNLPNGAIPPGGTVTVRIPITVDSGAISGDVVSVTFGNTSGGAQNQPYTNDGFDVYTQDNADGDTVDSPLTMAIETEAVDIPSNGEREASASQDSGVIAIASDPISPLAGQLVINEVLYAQSGGNNAAENDEFIELYNASGSALDISGFKLIDGDLISNPNVLDGTSGSITSTTTPYEFPLNTIIPAEGYVVIWIGDKNATEDPNLDPFPEKDAPNASFQDWLGSSPKLANTGDDVWLYDANTKLIDYVGYGSGGSVDPPPAGQWVSTDQTKLDGAPKGQSISLTPNGQDGNTSACWEKTTISMSSGDSASGRCTGFLETRDTDDLVISTNERITSVGVNNNGTTAEMLIVKRITAINGQVLNPNDGVTRLDEYVDDTASSKQAEDNHSAWPVDGSGDPELFGAINAGPVKPGDTVEYTIYFLNSGTTELQDIRLCDRLQPGLSFKTDAYGSAQDIQLKIGSDAALNLTAANDPGDRAQVILAGVSAPDNCNLQGANDNGVVLIDITGTAGTPNFPELPTATGAEAAQSYGHFKFVVKVDE